MKLFEGGSAINNSRLVTPVFVDITAAQLAVLNGTPITLVYSAGSGLVHMPVLVSADFKPGTEPFTQDIVLTVGWTGTALCTSGTVVTTGLTAQQAVFTPATGPIGDGDGMDLVLSADKDAGATGAIATATVGTAGTGYAVGDTGTIANPGTGTVATYEVTGVGGSGDVTGFRITSGGSQYVVATGLATVVVTGTGDGAFAVDVASITGLSDGVLRVGVLYYTMPLK